METGESDELKLAKSAALIGTMAYEQCVKQLTTDHGEVWVAANQPVVLACMQAGLLAHLVVSLEALRQRFAPTP